MSGNVRMSRILKYNTSDSYLRDTWGVRTLFELCWFHTPCTIFVVLNSFENGYLTLCALAFILIVIFNAFNF